jgi:hypothetical protein
LAECVVISGVDAIDGIQSVDCVSDCSAKGSHGVLVLTFGNDADGLLETVLKQHGVCVPCS